MRVLHWDFSERFIDFWDWFTGICRKKIIYRYIDEHPNPVFHGRQGETEMYPRFVYVYLNREALPELAEENAAHELSHVALFEQGYATVSLRNPRRTEWVPIVIALQSWVSDVLIDRKLLNFGYTNAEYHELIYRSTKENLIEYPEPSTNRLDQIGNALGYFYCHNCLPTEKWEDLRQLYRDVDPPVWELGNELAGLGDAMGFAGQASYLRFLIAIRDHLELQDFIAINDPAGKQIY
ncbi:MAG: hypothetical protein ACOX8W_00030 [bacterium]|jgi:hypothetical protein